MGIIKEHSNFRSIYYDNAYKSTIGLSAQEYVDKVNDGGYSESDFINDGVGFGIIQWSSSSRKEELINLCRGKIGDLNCQLKYFSSELKSDFSRVINLLKSSNDVEECTLEFISIAFYDEEINTSLKNRIIGYANSYYNIFRTPCEIDNCKVVIEASAKDAIDEETLEVHNKWIEFIFSLFDKYGIECIGRTPNVIRRVSKNSYLSMWKEDEIRLYLYRHPEIEHYCVIDDDDLGPNNSDLNKVRGHLLQTIYYSNNPYEEGLLKEHKEEIGRILNKDNEIRKLVLKKELKKINSNTNTI